jgi:hypothetical protein
MSTTRRFAVLLVLVLVLLHSGLIRASGSDDLPRIRTTDRRVHALIDAGVRHSATFRDLVDRLERSDVVVYVRCGRDPDARVAGRLTFVSAAGGLRYVVVRIVPSGARAHQIAVLAHELQHAVEIADTPAIVDSASLAREYLRMGHVNRHSTTPGIAFDTVAAIDAGRRVLGEISNLAAD